MRLIPSLCSLCCQFLQVLLLSLLPFPTFLSPFLLFSINTSRCSNALLVGEGLAHELLTIGTAVDLVAFGKFNSTLRELLAQLAAKAPFAGKALTTIRHILAVVARLVGFGPALREFHAHVSNVRVINTCASSAAVDAETATFALAEALAVTRTNVATALFALLSDARHASAAFVVRSAKGILSLALKNGVAKAFVVLVYDALVVRAAGVLVVTLLQVSLKGRRERMNTVRRRRSFSCIEPANKIL